MCGGRGHQDGHEYRRGGCEEVVILICWTSPYQHAMTLFTLINSRKVQQANVSHFPSLILCIYKRVEIAFEYLEYADPAKTCSFNYI